MTRRLGAFALAALAVGAALALAPAITQELWTAQLLVPVLAAVLLPLYLAVSLVRRRPNR